jgi:membrane-associated phospholipid phosphatase
MASTTPEQEQHGEAREGASGGAQGAARAGKHPHLPDAAEHAVEQVERERVPEGLVQYRGRILLVAYVVVLLLVGALAFAAHTFSVLPGDLKLTRELQDTSNPAFFDLMYTVSYIGYPTLSAIILVVIALLLAAVRMWLASIFVVLSLIADGIGGLLKIIVARHRPLPSLVHVTQQISDPSFPSGHTLHYTVFYGFLAFVLAVEFRPSGMRNILIGVCVLLVVLVGPSRVYLGEHWTSDVIGGYLIGLLCLVPLSAGYLWARDRLRARHAAQAHAS